MQLANQRAMTRRGIVSAVYSTFDPLGFIAPYVMKAELLLRLGWDDPLEEDDKKKQNKTMKVLAIRSPKAARNVSRPLFQAQGIW